MERLETCKECQVLLKTVLKLLKTYSHNKRVFFSLKIDFDFFFPSLSTFHIPLFIIAGSWSTQGWSSEENTTWHKGASKSNGSDEEVLQQLLMKRTQTLN